MALKFERKQLAGEERRAAFREWIEGATQLRIR